MIPAIAVAVLALLPAAAMLIVAVSFCKPRVSGSDTNINQRNCTMDESLSIGEQLQAAHERIAQLESELAEKVKAAETSVEHIGTEVGTDIKNELAAKAALIEEVIPHVQAVTDQAPAAHLGLRAWLVKVFDHLAGIEVSKSTSTEQPEQATT